MSALSEEKNALRRRMREAVFEMTDSDRAMQSRAVCERLMLLDGFIGAKTVLMFMPMWDECDILPAIAEAYRQNKRVAFPLCEGEHELGLYIAPDISCLIPGKYGILEPDVTLCERTDAACVQFAAVPGVAFDRKLNRLGRGAGYYDNLLSCTKMFKAGVGFDCRLVDKVPVDCGDVPLDCVMTNKWIFCK